MTTQTSAAAPLFDAIADAINADAALSAMLAGDRVYSLLVPNGALAPYLVLGNISGSSFSTFAREGEASAITLHIWTAGADGAEALAIYGELFRLLNFKALTIAGHAHLRGALTLTTISPDPGGELIHLVATYRPTTIPV